MHPARLRRALVAALVAVAVASGGLLAADPAAVAEDDAAVQQALEPFYAVLQYVRTFAYRPVSLERLVDGAIRGLVEALGDPYSAYMSPEEYESFSVTLEGSYTGVGMQIEQRGDEIFVVAPFPGSPAERAGIRPGDRIVAVDGVEVRGMSVEAVAARVRGPEGAPVVLTIQRGDGPAFEVRVVRARIELRYVDARVLQGTDVGYIRILQFGDGVSRTVATSYDRLLKAGVKAIVLDLRNNPGGLLHEAVEVARVFVPEGPIVHVVSRTEGTHTYDAVGREPGPPVAVLVNQGSASASEIVAAAIRQNGAGFLVGQRTFGKGTVQTVVEVPGGGALRLTTAEYLPPDRVSLDGKGLQPDVEVPLPPDPADLAPLTGRWTLRPGDRGLEVLGLQQRLRLAGHPAGREDGVFGPATAAALRRFQRAAGLPATGVYDAATHRSLVAEVERRLARSREDRELQAALAELARRLDAASRR